MEPQFHAITGMTGLFVHLLLEGPPRKEQRNLRDQFVKAFKLKFKRTPRKERCAMNPEFSWG